MPSTVRTVSLLPSATELVHVVLKEAELQAGGPINVEMVGSALVINI